MRPINIYTLTRVSQTLRLERLERQMSKRKHYLKIKEWEIQGLKDFSERLAVVMEDSQELCFYYSFVMPKLGKEFDLLRVNEDCVVNVELKSGEVSDEMIQKQLLQNRYYLATLGKNMYSYTYVSSLRRLVRLSNSGRLVEADWEELAKVLERQTDCYTGHIEELFKEDRYLISPLTDPGRFLRQEYFLTSQQKDIRKQILKNVQKSDAVVSNSGSQDVAGEGLIAQGFTGLPGTGKTLLLYDIAMQLSWRERVCIFHFGSHAKELEQLDERLKRIDFYYFEAAEKVTVRNRYSAIFVDEGHRIWTKALRDILSYAEEWNAPVIFSYDCEDAISPKERKRDGAGLIESIPGYIKYHLTNRIRVNSELSSFIGCVMYVRSGNHRQEYPSVSLAYANTAAEAELLLHNFEKEGYIYIWDAALDLLQGDHGHRDYASVEFADQNNACRIETSAAACKEFDKVVMLMDDSFGYDRDGYLRFVRNANEDETKETGKETENIEDSRVRNLFHGLSRAKKRVGIVVLNNERVFDALLSIVQK